MAAEYLTAWHKDALVAAHTALIDVVGSAAKITIHDSSDIKLAEVILESPCGTVDAVTGELTLTVLTQEDSAAYSGVAEYATLRRTDDTALRSIPCQIGGVSVAGYCVLNTRNITQGAAVEVIAASVL
jgi:hypothetical protein